MEKIVSLKRYFVLALLCIMVLLFINCNGIKKMRKNYDVIKIELPSDVLEVHADSIDIVFEVVIPPKYFYKKAIMKIEPSLRFEKDTIALEPIYVRGEKVITLDDINTTISQKEGGKISYTSKIAYQPSMKNAIMYVHFSFKIDSKYDELDVCASADKPFKLAEGCITTSLTVKNTDDLSLVGDFTQEEKEVKGTVYFKINKSKLEKSEKENEDMNKFREMIIDSTLDIKGVTLYSSASPDGTVELNTKLTKSRNATSFAFLVDEFSKLGLETVFDSNFKQKANRDEDWEGFKALIAKSNLENKNDILAIINSTQQPDDKEDNIRKLGKGSWEQLAREILPRLRKSEIGVIALFPVIRDFETLKQFQNGNKLDSLNNKELLLLAFNQDDLDKKLEVYTYYSNKNPDEWIGKNNVAFVHLMKDEDEKAIEILKELEEKYKEKNDPESKKALKSILNNLGICYRRDKQYNKAIESYNKAKDLGAKEDNNLGIVNIHVANYDAAINSFETDRCDYNKALAYVLKKDYDNAKKTIECIEEKSADDFYLRAIIGARTEDLDLMGTSLTRAIQLDPSIRDRAKKDNEFRNYWEKAEFTNAIR